MMMDFNSIKIDDSIQPELSPFILNRDDYTRKIDPINQYYDQAAHYLSLMNDVPYEDCLNWVRKNVNVKSDKNNPLMEIKNPRVKYIGKDEHGDREFKETTLYGYINSSVKNNDLISPTLTTYIHPSKRESLNVRFIGNGVANRNKAKKSMFANEVLMMGDPSNPVHRMNYNVDNATQNYEKTKNNSVSGAGAIATNIHYNPTMHSTLTSTCRSASAYANANNEKFLMGNRHYWSPTIVLNNVLAISTISDLKKINKAVEIFKLHIPTPQETMDVVLKSSRLYWNDTHKENEIFELIKKLSDTQRCAFVYVSDFYQVAQYNPEFMRTLILNFSKYPTLDNNIDVDKYIHTDEEITNLAIQICRDKTIGLNMKEEFKQKTEIAKLVASKVRQLYFAFDYYKDFIKGLLLTDNVPPSIAYFPKSIRHAALMSDTDSTIFTTEYWNKWMNGGEIVLNDESNGYFAVMVYFSNAILKHLLAMMSANFGIAKERLFQIAMKNEFKFDVFVPTDNTKHYYSIISYQEGNVWAKIKQEIKGVHLMASDKPKEVIQEAAMMMKDICETVRRGEQLDVQKYMTIVAKRERDIKETIRSGKMNYYRRATIKGSYTLEEEKSPLRHYKLWNETFGKKYGETAPPPYSCAKIPTTLINKSSFNEWLDTMEDQDLAKRLRNYFNQHGRTEQGNWLIPKEACNDKLPMELVKVVDERKLIADICKCHYLVLSTLGVIRGNQHHTRLIHDEMQEDDYFTEDESNYN